MNKRYLIAGLLTLTICGFSLDASAQRKGKGKAKAAATSETSAASTSTGAVKQTNYDFDDDLVSGDLVRPDGEQLVVRRRGERRSLVRLREHFIPEMLKSVEDL